MHILKDSKATRKSKHASHCCHQDLLDLFPTHTSEKGDCHRHHSVGVLVSTKSGLGNLTREEGGHRNTTVCWESLSCVVFFLLGVDNKKVIHIFMIYRIGFVLVNELKTSSIIMPSNIDVNARGRVPECWSPYTKRDILSPGFLILLLSAGFPILEVLIRIGIFRPGFFILRPAQGFPRQPCPTRKPRPWP